MKERTLSLLVIDIGTDSVLMSIGALHLGGRKLRYFKLG